MFRNCFIFTYQMYFSLYLCTRQGLYLQLQLNSLELWDDKQKYPFSSEIAHICFSCQYHNIKERKNSCLTGVDHHCRDDRNPDAGGSVTGAINCRKYVKNQPTKQGTNHFILYARTLYTTRYQTHWCGENYSHFDKCMAHVLQTVHTRTPRSYNWHSSNVLPWQQGLYSDFE
jgi:hypothetical protein